MRKEKGFSLIELLIVVAIILIIVSIAIPTLNTAQVTYAATYPAVGFSPNLKSLGPSAAPPACDKTAACLIDNVLACSSATGCPKSGYNYFMVGATPSASGVVGDYAASASPIVVNS